MQRTF